VQYAALVGIGSNDDVDVTKLSSLIAFDRSTLGFVVERLESRGLIRRTSRATDRRTKVLKLTPAGRRLLDAVEPAVQRAQQRMLAPLSTADRKQFMRLLDIFVEANNSESRVPLRLSV
jgi:DNA-binding MarR family transcriptional regulator